jgi:hypothetical protein
VIYISINHIYSFGYAFKRYTKPFLPGKKTGRENGLKFPCFVDAAESEYWVA